MSFKQVSVTLGSVIAGLECTFIPLLVIIFTTDLNGDIDIVTADILARPHKSIWYFIEPFAIYCIFMKSLLFPCLKNRIFREISIIWHLNSKYFRASFSQSLLVRCEVALQRTKQLKKAKSLSKYGTPSSLSQKTLRMWQNTFKTNFLKSKQILWHDLFFTILMSFKRDRWNKSAQSATRKEKARRNWHRCDDRWKTRILDGTRSKSLAHWSAF